MSHFSQADAVFIERPHFELLVCPNLSTALPQCGSEQAAGWQGGESIVLGASENSHLMEALQSLTSEVAKMRGQLSAQLNPAGAATEQTAEKGAFSFRRADSSFATPSSEDYIENAKPPLPDARLVHLIIRKRQLRSHFFDSNLFADPAWDMLLDLCAASVEFKRVSVMSLCIASGVPSTTALRLIGQMVDAGVFKRVEDQIDRRRAFIELSDEAANSMARYFATAGNETVSVI